VQITQQPEQPVGSRLGSVAGRGPELGNDLGDCGERAA
jgi:hypothetical protein